MDNGIIAALIGVSGAFVLSAGANACVSIYWAGRIGKAVEDHERRLHVVESQGQETALLLAELKGRETA